MKGDTENNENMYMWEDIWSGEALLRSWGLSWD